jgi:transcriptional regulator with XRE-family HTH domain
MRLETGLSQEALADEAGIDRSYIGGVERGEHNVALVNLVKISKSLKITVSELLSKAKL